MTMQILVSTNMYRGDELGRVLPYLSRFDGQVGAEIFPMFHDNHFERILQKCLPELAEVPVSFHGPYYQTEHSASVGTPEYERTMSYVDHTLEYCRMLKSRYMVFHHNNCYVTRKRKREMIRIACENYREIECLYGNAGIPVVVENAGVMDRGNMLLNEVEFTELCLREKYPVLIDIGHAWANGWNWRRVIETLRRQIVAYHLHNNDGIHDSHQRIHRGSLDFDEFLRFVCEQTPEADWVVEYAMDVADDEAGICEDIEFLIDRRSNWVSMD